MTMAEARAAYLGLRDRAREAAPSQREYIDLLWASWDGALAKWPPETPLPAGAESLTRVIGDPRLTEDSVVEWLDAYPSGVVDRLPGGMFA